MLGGDGGSRRGGFGCGAHGESLAGEPALAARSRAAYTARIVFASQNLSREVAPLDESGVDGLERLRRVLSWICVTVFALTFTGLLALSATTYWTPDNPLILSLDRAWRVSGLVGLTLWAIPYAVRAARWLGQQLSSGR